ncbi:MAG: hypothetical protein ACXVEF_18065 [Polyangiales bacterium]
MWRIGALSILLATSSCHAPTVEVTSTEDAAADSVATDPRLEELAAAKAVAMALCPALKRYLPSVFASTWRDLDACIEGQTRRIARGAFAYGATWTPAERRSCGLKWADLDASAFARAWLEGVGDAACIRKGTLADGSPCLGGQQCAGSGCLVPPGHGPCGTCVTRLGEGAPCSSNAQCAFGTVCSGPSGAAACARLREIGEACDDAKPCHVDAACVSGKCTVLPAPGEACLPSGSCDPSGLLGVFCNQTTGKCELAPVRALGEPCAELPNGLWGLCAAGGACLPSSGGGGACVPALGVGQSCAGLWASSPCAAPSECTWSLGTVCADLDPDTCNRPGASP